jgi:phosphoribosylformylglycinamidine synthase
MLFPGSNCDYDCYHAVTEVLKEEAEFIWHANGSPLKYDCIILPGGFSYGDYLRPGALAKFAPAMERLKEYAAGGGLVLGICNGFQILLEAGLLPGAMLRNKGLKFICQEVHLKVEKSDSPFSNLFRPGQVVRIPINHYEGNYLADQETLDKITNNSQVLFHYCDRKGRVSDQANPNGSLANIAGLTNEAGNVLGMMPHPERCCERELGGEDGLLVFRSIANFLKKGKQSVASQWG